MWLRGDVYHGGNSWLLNMIVCAAFGEKWASRDLDVYNAMKNCEHCECEFPKTTICLCSESECGGLVKKALLLKPHVRGHTYFRSSDSLSKLGDNIHLPFDSIGEKTAAQDRKYATEERYREGLE